MVSGLSREEILTWLRQEDEAALENLWQRADAVRKQAVGDAVHLRGLIGSPTTASASAATADCGRDTRVSSDTA
jgi:hypothetical protein